MGSNEARDSGRFVHVVTGPGDVLVLPAWMLDPIACAGMGYELPMVLRWITGNIGIHHVHHLSSRIPFYRLPEVLGDHPELAAIGRVTLLDSLKGVRLVL